MKLRSSYILRTSCALNARRSVSLSCKLSASLQMAASGYLHPRDSFSSGPVCLSLLHFRYDRRPPCVGSSGSSVAWATSATARAGRPVRVSVLRAQLSLVALRRARHLTGARAHTLRSSLIAALSSQLVRSLSAARANRSR